MDSNSRPVTPMKIPDASSGPRLPRSATRRPESGAKIAVIAAIGSVISPAFIAENPRTSWR